MGAVRALRPSALAGESPRALVEAWMRELDASGRSPVTLAGHRWHALAAFADLAASRGLNLDDLDLATVTHTELVDYLAACRHAPDRRYTANARSARTERSDYTLARRAATLRTFFAWAAAHSHVPANPAAGLPTPKVRTHLPRALEVDDALLLFRAAALGLRCRLELRDSAASPYGDVEQRRGPQRRTHDRHGVRGSA